MSFIKYAATAAALFSGALAATCSTSGTLTITASAQASVLATCQTYSGSIAVATDVPAVALDGPFRVTGDITVANNDMLTSFSASSLRIIDGALKLQSLSNIQTVSLPQLVEAAQFTITSTGQYLLMLGLTGLTQVNILDIEDTFLNDISGITLVTAENVTIATNQLLTELEMPVKNVTGTFSIRGNTRGLSVTLDELVDVGELLVNDVTSISLKSFANSTGLVSFQNNEFKTLDLPNITIARGGFAVSSNEVLTNLTVPKLQAVGGGLNIVNNTDLTGTYSLPSLEGAASVTFEGNFTKVPGTGYFFSPQDISSVCSSYTNKIANVKCHPNYNINPSSVSGAITSATSTSKPNAASTASPETMFSIFGALAALFGLLM